MKFSGLKISASEFYEMFPIFLEEFAIKTCPVCGAKLKKS